MGWKDWSYWLKGGIIGLILFFLVLIIVSLKLNSDFAFIVYFLLWMPLLFLEDSALFFYQIEGYPQPTILGIVCIGIVYFLVGSLLGWIVGKVKSRNQ